MMKVSRYLLSTLRKPPENIIEHIPNLLKAVTIKPHKIPITTRWFTTLYKSASFSFQNWHFYTPKAALWEAKTIGFAK